MQNFMMKSNQSSKANVENSSNNTLLTKRWIAAWSNNDIYILRLRSTSTTLFAFFYEANAVFQQINL